MRLALISDIHEDVDSLKKAFKEIGKLRVSEIACLGDIVGFSNLFYPYCEGKNAEICVRMVKETCKYAVLGNHDLFHLKKRIKTEAIQDFPEDFFLLDNDDRVNSYGKSFWTYEDDCNVELSDHCLDYLNSLNEFVVLKNNILLSHYLFPDITGITQDFKLFPGQCSEHFAFVEEQGCKFSFSGHMHAEGLLRFSKNSRRFRKYGTYDLKDKFRHIFVPPIASGTKQNGFLVIDFDEKRIEAIKIPQ